MKIDKTWFRDQIQKNGYASERQFAIKFYKAETEDKILSAQGKVNRMLSGDRKMQAEEIYRLSYLLNVSIIEIFNHLGLKVGSDGRVK